MNQQSPLLFPSPPSFIKSNETGTSIAEPAGNLMLRGAGLQTAYHKHVSRGNSLHDLSVYMDLGLLGLVLGYCELDVMKADNI